MLRLLSKAKPYYWILICNGNSMLILLAYISICASRCQNEYNMLEWKFCSIYEFHEGLDSKDLELLLRNSMRHLKCVIWQSYSNWKSFSGWTKWVGPAWLVSIELPTMCWLLWVIDYPRTSSAIFGHTFYWEWERDLLP